MSLTKRVLVALGLGLLAGLLVLAPYTGAPESRQLGRTDRHSLGERHSHDGCPPRRVLAHHRHRVLFQYAGRPRDRMACPCVFFGAAYTRCRLGTPHCSAALCLVSYGPGHNRKPTRERGRRNGLDAAYPGIW